MMRVTPLRFTTRQCSQIGCTLVLTFTASPSCRAGKSGKTLKIGTLECPCKGRSMTIPDSGSDSDPDSGSDSDPDSGSDSDPGLGSGERDLVEHSG